MKILRSSLLVLLLGGSAVQAAELAVLTPETWGEFAPQGKEVDGIYGDYVLRNDQIVVVIAQPIARRNANMTVRDVGGCIIDLTRSQQQSDQLSAYYPGGGRYLFHAPESVQLNGQQQGEQAVQQGTEVSWSCTAIEQENQPSVTLRYSLADGHKYVLVETTYRNSHQQALQEELVDAIRADRTFQFGTHEPTGLFWAHDQWFRQAYGVLAEQRKVEGTGERGRPLRLTQDGRAEVTIEPGQSVTVRRRIFPGANAIDVRSLADQLSGQSLHPVAVTVSDPSGPVTDAQVTLTRDGEPYGAARTGDDGRLQLELPEGQFQVSVAALGRPEVKQALDTNQAEHEVQLEACGYVVGQITDDRGQAIPCKVAFHGRNGTETPFFGPDSRAVGVHNLHYSHNGTFRQELGPGDYEVIISYGPEYDAVTQSISIERGRETALKASLRRVVDTEGWISSDFHSHSSPSGDNTASQFGRVLNLLCEHIEFAPCTEHNRLSTYVPHLRRIDAEELMATCTGMELTGSPLPVNHQNAFPLERKPRTQDGGGPQTDLNPVVQIERLAMWDGGSDKLVQQNHPNIVQILSDKDLDGKADGGFEGMFGYMDVIEVHPPAGIFQPPALNPAGESPRNAIFHWMQLLNLGYRIPGVVNTDAHYNFHGSGGLRNYLASPTDKPAEIQTMDVVRAAEAGHIIMTTGPFLTVHARSSSAGQPVTAGDDLRAEGGRVELSIRVQCSNWLDVNRVQIFLNGRPVDSLNFTRRQHPDRFKNEVVKFDATLPLELTADTHIIVATAGEGLSLAPVMGDSRTIPVAVSNPIFVDVDGNGFQANGDLLDRPRGIRD